MSAPDHQHTQLGLGPAPASTQPLPGLQHPTFQQPPPHFGYPYLYTQPYGTAPQQWGYGHHAAGGLPNAPGGFLNAGGIPNTGGIPNAGGMANTGGNVDGYLNPGGTPAAGGFPNPVPQPMPNAQVVAGNQEGAALTAVQPARTYPNIQVMEGGTSHLPRQQLTY